MRNVLTSAPENLHEVFGPQAALKPLEKCSIDETASALVTGTCRCFLYDCWIESSNPVGDPEFRS